MLKHTVRLEEGAQASNEFSGGLDTTYTPIAEFGAKIAFLGGRGQRGDRNTDEAARATIIIRAREDLKKGQFITWVRHRMKDRRFLIDSIMEPDNEKAIISAVEVEEE
jgi:hypothetical protein